MAHHSTDQSALGESLTVDTGQGDAHTVTAPPGSICCLLRPSIDAHAEPRLPGGTTICNTMVIRDNVALMTSCLEVGG